MNRKQIIIVSVTGIFLVLLILVGLTYAYFLTQITGNTNPKSISVATADLRLTYGDGTTQILTSNTKLVPSANPIGTKDFTVTNDGDATNYAVIIENVIVKDATTEELTTFNSNDFVYTLSCTSNNGTCNGVSEQTILPMSDNILVENDIAKNEIHTYEIVLYYLETNKDQSADMNKTLEARINIEDPNAINPYSSNTNSLAYNVINNAMNITQDQLNSGYAAYRNTPITIPNENVSGRYYGAVSTELNEGIPNNSSFFVISDDYRIHQYGYGFYFDNAQVVEYTGDLNNVVIYENGVSTGETTTMIGKYIRDSRYYTQQEESYAFPTLSSATTAAKESAEYIIDKFWIIESETTSTKLYYREIFLNTESIESTLSETPDDYTKTTGIKSYYYRGGVKNNYVEFNNKCWRIVRIEGDGSVKITLAAEKKCSNITQDDTTTAFIDKGHYGYTTDKFPNYDNSIDNTNSMKYKFNQWLNSFSLDVKNKLKSSEICIGDLSTFYDDEGNELLELIEFGYSNYDNWIRLRLNEPSLICSLTATKTISSKVYPLTADEIVFAGDKYDVENYSSYLTDNAHDIWWTISPMDYNQMTTESSVFIKRTSGMLEGIIYNSNNLRPAVSLIEGVEIESGGTGTIDNPYTIKMN